MKEKLIELLTAPISITESVLGEEATPKMQMGRIFAEKLADHLIANGVTIPVLCKDCKSCMFCYPEKQIGKEPTPGWYCKEQKSYRRPDDFCSYGERRNDGK